MAFVGLLGIEMPANQNKRSRRVMPAVGPRTAQYGLDWPNEWPNGEIHARDYERARSARDGRDRSCRHGVDGSSNHHERTRTDAAGALSGQLAASFTRWLPAANDLTNPHVYRRVWVTAPAGKAQALARSPPLARSSTRVASGTSRVALHHHEDRRGPPLECPSQARDHLALPTPGGPRPTGRALGRLSRRAGSARHAWRRCAGAWRTVAGDGEQQRA